jgi:hypothetical protein
VFARLVDPQTQQSGLTGFIVRQGASGLRIGEESLTMGLRGIMQNALHFEDVPVTARDVLGELGRGTEPADDAVMVARLGVGAIAVGGMKRCAQLMLRYAERRAVATGRLLHNPITLAKLSDLTAMIATLESLMETIAATLDSGHSIPREAAVIAKIAGSEFLWQAADDLMQLLGGRGYMDNNLASQLLRDARVLRIGEGPNESLKIFLGKSVLHTDKLEQFLRDRLHAPQLADQLKNAADQINHRCLTMGIPFDDRSFAMAWAYSLTGDVAIHALLLAAVQQSRSPQAQRVVEWARIQFEQRLRHAVAGIPGEELIADAETIRTSIDGYSASINDIEQNLAGENHDLDDLLKRHADDHPDFYQNGNGFPDDHGNGGVNGKSDQNGNNRNGNRDFNNNLNGNSNSVAKNVYDNGMLVTIETNSNIPPENPNHHQDTLVINSDPQQNTTESIISKLVDQYASQTSSEILPSSISSATIEHFTQSIDADCDRSIVTRIAQEIETVRLLADKIAMTVQRKP